jgi:glycosyltransferase involved in cell wall biosynthesis
MKVVHVQHSSKSAGGAALRLHNAFIESDIDSYILTLHDDINDTERVNYSGSSAKFVSRIEDKIHNFITRKCNKEYGLFTYPYLGTDISKKKLIKDADVIYIHWVQRGFMNFSGYRRLARLGKPVIIFMHDMWSITGGCHYSFSCEKYKTKCSDCQFFKGHKTNDLSSKGFNNKLKIYSRYNNFYFISPSKWLQECARNSSLTKTKSIFHVPNVLDDNIFKPVDKKSAKRLFNINEEDNVIAFGAVSIDSPYKGWEYLQKALGKLTHDFETDRLTVLIFGKCNNNKLSEMIPFKTRFTGFLKDEFSTTLVYNAADVFVTPSLADNLPTTILESLSCGTPVVGFNTGGIPDMIEHKVNGYLAEYRNADDLAEGIKFCIRDKTKGRLLPEFKRDTILSQHADILSYIMKNKMY